MKEKFDIHKKKYSFDDLVQIVKILRSPEGCPWDAEQTNQSIKQALIEEAYEALDSLDKGEDDKFYDELGDVLLQVVFHSEIASETGRFDVSDVTTAICSKMIHRHPHVFGEDSGIDTAEKVLDRWEDIKKKEKGLESQTQIMRDVPASLPALIRAYKIQQKAAKVGFDWDNIDDVFDKLTEEIYELRQAMKSDKGEAVLEEMGDVLFSVVNIARHLHVAPEMALTATSEKFIKRFEFVEKKVIENNQNIQELSLEQLDKYWEDAKCE